jgi:hypothetical protein
MPLIGGTTEQIITDTGLIGYKCLEYSQNTPILLSQNNFIWTPQQTVTALCAHNCKQIIGEKCSCGIYAVKNLDHLIEMSYRVLKVTYKIQLKVVVKLSLWGRVLIAEKGYRAEKAKILEITVDHYAENKDWALEFSYTLGKVYGVPSTVQEVEYVKPSELKSQSTTTSDYVRGPSYEELLLAYKNRANIKDPTERQKIKLGLQKLVFKRIQYNKIEVNKAQRKLDLANSVLQESQAIAVQVSGPDTTKIKYRKWNAPDTAPMDNVGRITSVGRKWVHIKNIYGKDDWAKLDGWQAYTE